MKVLVATKEGQGVRQNDFCWADEGEPVGFPFECDGERVDGPCGCRRSFSGLNSLKGTTTAKVVEMDVTEEQFLSAYRLSLVKGGWLKFGEPSEEADLDAKELLRLASRFPTGAVVEKRGGTFRVRGAKR